MLILIEDVVSSVDCLIYVSNSINLIVLVIGIAHLCLPYDFL